ncbi:D-3-phosphoglycerate dehydrogenase, partial [Elysia marginata]
MNILHLDSNHPKLIASLEEQGHTNIIDYNSPYEEVLKKIGDINGIILRSRIPIEKVLMDKAPGLNFIARVGVGMENIDIDYAMAKGIKLFSAKGGNSNAVGEHTLGMLLSLTKKIVKSHTEIHQNIWKREENRGVELSGKTVVIIGYGNTGQAFAKKLQGFDVQVLFYDILEKQPQYSNVKKASLTEIQEQADI